MKFFLIAAAFGLLCCLSDVAQAGHSLPKHWDLQGFFDQQQNVTHLEKRGNNHGRLLQKHALMTFYWTATQGDYKKGGPRSTLSTCSGKHIAKVSQDFAFNCVLEGSCMTPGGAVINLGNCRCNTAKHRSGYPCFELLNKKDFPHGETSYGEPLRPFTTIATNEFPRGTKIYVKQIDGWNLPGSRRKHNGCLLVQDRSWSFGKKAHQIDFFSVTQKNYRILDGRYSPNRVDIYHGGNCKILKYI